MSLRQACSAAVFKSQGISGTSVRTSAQGDVEIASEDWKDIPVSTVQKKSQNNIFHWCNVNIVKKLEVRQKSES